MQVAILIASTFNMSTYYLSPSPPLLRIWLNYFGVTIVTFSPDQISRLEKHLICRTGSESKLICHFLFDDRNFILAL